MGRSLGIEPAEIFRLSEFACNLAGRMSCTVSEAIAYLERHVSGQSHIVDVSRCARIAKKFRMSRNERFGVHIFRDPAWDMLLDLLIAQNDGKRLSVSALCLGSGVAMTTALRHLERLERFEFVTRVGDSRDERRVFVDLIPERRDDLIEFLSEWQRYNAGTPPSAREGHTRGAPQLAPALPPQSIFLS